jgi:HD-GYP domain-containing protein (c-di-GMP phosphodiesterase class II)
MRAPQAMAVLDQVLRNLRIHREPVKNQRRILQAAADLIEARSILWAPAHGEASLIFAGEPCISAWDGRQMVAGLAQFPEWLRDEPFVCNDVGANAWARRFPQVHSLLGLPLADPGLPGWIIVLNKRESDPDVQPEFTDADAALLKPFVSLFSLHLRSAVRYLELKDLLVGLTRSLTAAVDAKDSYTYGHSERVARISMELGRELGLGEEDLSDIYLAGLLHDIGKIGVPDEILCKRGPLTPEEFERIKRHPVDGYKILKELRPISSLLPGVLYHHERWDGQGYPENLAGENIPFLARVLAVADSYDAMSTARPYRGAMNFDEVEKILVQGAGNQWDPRVIDAFLRCRVKVHLIRQRGVGESLCMALEGALRKDGSGVHERGRLASPPPPAPANPSEATSAMSMDSHSAGGR